MANRETAMRRLPLALITASLCPLTAAVAQNVPLRSYDEQSASSPHDGYAPGEGNLQRSSPSPDQLGRRPPARIPGYDDAQSPPPGPAYRPYADTPVQRREDPRASRYAHAYDNYDGRRPR